MKKTLKLYLEFPKALVENLWKNEKIAAWEIKKAAVLNLVRTQVITSSRGAELLEMNYHDFLDLMAQEGIPVINYESADLDQEIKDLDEELVKG
ncbi:MAG: UPF0175 family protein [bacterium]